MSSALRRDLEANPQIGESLAEVGIHGVEDLASCFLCACESLKDYLHGAKINRDGNLNIQYRGWKAYYQHNLPEMRRLFMELRAYDENVFVLPAGERHDFRAAPRRTLGPVRDRTRGSGSAVPQATRRAGRLT